MQRLQSIDPDAAQGKTKELLDTVRNTFGTTPNVARVLANSPAALEAFLAFSSAMGGATLGDKLISQIKLNTSESNACDYCTSILSAMGAGAGLSADDILAGRTGQSDDARAKAALTFANAVLETHGKVTFDQIAHVREAGFDDTQIVEIVTSVVMGCFTNFVNNVADTALDIPKAEAIASSSCSTEGSCD